VDHNEDLLGLDRDLSKLERVAARAAKVVEMRFFGGLLEDEIAEALEVSIITVKRDWKVARAWLHGQLGRQKAAGERSGREINTLALPIRTRIPWIYAIRQEV
jgi:hypothetical protein